MSLISEALNKARQEAARQDAQRQRSPFAVGAADAVERRNGLVPVLAGVGAGCLIAGLIVAVAWSAGWGPFASPASPVVEVSQSAPSPPGSVGSAVEPSPPPPAAIPQKAAPAPIETPAASPSPPVPVTRSQPVLEVPSAPAEAAAERRAPPAPVEPERAPAAASPSTPAQVPSAAPSSAPSTAPPRQATGGLVDGRTYVGEVPIPSGGAVRLNGIAFSPERPVAVLDGRVMGPGEAIHGFTIAAIEAGRVKLQGYGTTVFVSPK